MDHMCRSKALCVLGQTKKQHVEPQKADPEKDRVLFEALSAAISAAMAK
jgi:hypothetical protein